MTTRRQAARFRDFGPLGLLALPLLMIGAAANAQAPAQTPPAAGGTTTVVVTGQRPQVSRKIDRKVYRVDKDLQSKTGSASDVLNNIPSVAVDMDGNISLRGNNVTVLVDGKPSPQFSGPLRGDALQQMPADQIEQVEIITNPSAQFKPDGSGGIINIVTKKARKDGTSGVASVNIGNDGRFNAGLSGAATKGPLTLSGGLNFRHDDRARTLDETRTATTGGAPVTTARGSTDHVRRDGTSTRGSIEYALTDQDKLTASANYSLRTGDRHGSEHDAESTSAGTTSDTLRTTSGRLRNIDNGASLGFEHKFDQDGEELSVSLQHDSSIEKERYTYLNTFTVPATGPTRDWLRLGYAEATTEFSADYTLPFGEGHELQLGYDMERNESAFDNAGGPTDATGTNTTDPALTNAFNYRQVVNAAYATYQTTAGKFGVLAGLRLEQTDVRSHSITGNAVAARGYFKVYPTLHLKYTLSDEQSLTASYSRRVERPDAEDVNPYTDHQDVHNLRAGNPNLKPEETDSFELGYTYETAPRSYDLTAYYRRTQNGVTDITTVLSPDVTLTTKQNLLSSRSGGLEFAANGRLLPKLDYTLSGNVYYRQIDANTVGLDTRANVSYSAKTSLNFKPTAADTLQLSGNFNGKRITPQGYVDPVSTYNLGYSHQIRGNLNLVATVSDLLNSQKMHSHIVTTGLNGDITRHQQGRVAFIGLTYLLGNGKKPKPGDFQYDAAGG
ncbi:MAG TPA: outer membrane beta-barrel family protein [Asticcacaulis sp.]|nr:outer membrane beta-barrel family protein [Asticcacaulis sp.]